MTTTTKAKTTDSKSTDAKAAETVAEQIQAVGKETLETVVKTGSEAASKGFEQAVDMTRGQVDAAVKSYDDFTGFSRGNYDAMVEAGTKASKGIEALNAEMMSLAKDSLEDSVKAAKAFSSVKSVKELMDLQSKLAKQNYEKFVARSVKFNEMAFQAMQDAASPLVARAGAVAEEMNLATKR